MVGRNETFEIQHTTSSRSTGYGSRHQPVDGQEPSNAAALRATAVWMTHGQLPTTFRPPSAIELRLQSNRVPNDPHLQRGHRRRTVEAAENQVLDCLFMIA